ncbi:MAG: GTPase HflX [Clostridia bacterium]|nr:GTPase HflX [Clostridia bacterium]
MTEELKSLSVLVGICPSTSALDECERSLDELERLLDTAGGIALAKVIQVKETFDPRTCIGSGKVEEIRALCENEKAELVVFDFELTPAQIRNLEKDLDGPAVIDRSMLILDIFAKHAVSGEGKLQVELAQLKYSAPRLIGKGTELSRQGGGIGSRGPGESKLETDRRHLKERVVALEHRLAELERNRAVMRASRDRSGIPKIAVVGYTNAGKSTLLNTLTGAGVLSENKLFATLDPTTRKMELPSGECVLITDTVGFIRKLPHHLVKAFKSTLDEVKYADILLVVSDASDPELSEHLQVTREIAEQLGAADKPVIYAYNKCDILDAVPTDGAEDSVFISALDGFGIEALLSLIEDVLQRTKKKSTLLIPYAEQSVLSAIYNSYSVESVDYEENGIRAVAVLDSKGLGMYGKYLIDN